MGIAQTTTWVAFSAGVFSFLSPCVLPLIPSYLSFITGMSLDDLRNGDQASMRRTAVTHALIFVLGFTLVFVALGATATAVGGIMNRYQGVLRWVGGGLVVVLGLHFAGLFSIRFLQQEKRIHLQGRPLGYLGSFLIGLTFALGWTPCIGPILGSILMVAATESSMTKGIVLLSAYSLGFGIPFLLAAAGLNAFLTSYRKFSRHLPIVIKTCGAFLVLIGVLIMTNNLSSIGLMATNLFGGQ